MSSNYFTTIFFYTESHANEEIRKLTVDDVSSTSTLMLYYSNVLEREWNRAAIILLNNCEMM